MADNGAGAPAIRHPHPRRILVIKLGALGDFVQALGPMRAIRRHHHDAHIMLLTTPPFAAFGRDCGCFDDVAAMPRPRVLDVAGWLALRRFLNGGGFARVYDLQNSDRTALYMRLFTARNQPDWVGAAVGAAIRNTDPARTAGHAFDGHVQTLALAGVCGVTVDDLSWMGGDAARFGVTAPYALLIPGSAPGRPEKRWPAESYAALAARLAARGLQPVIVAGTDEAALATRISAGAGTEILDLAGRTALTDIPALARGAALAVGNDTGPMHMIAPTGCPALVLFSGHSDPARHAPLGPRVHTLQRDTLDALAVGDVMAECEKILGGG